MKKSLFPFFFIFVLFNFAANFAHPVTPAFIVERQLDSSMFGIAMAAMLTMNFLTSPFWGKLCNYIPTRRIQTITCLGYSAGQLLFLLCYQESTVVLARLFAGCFTGGAFTAFTNYVINVSPTEKRTRNLTLLVTIQSVSSAVGYFLGGMLGMISVEAAFIAQIVLLALCGILFHFVSADDTEYKVRPAMPLTLRESNPFLAFRTVQQHMTSMLALVFAIVAVSSIGQNSYEQCFNYYIKDQFGMSSVYNGTFKALIALMTLLLNSTVCIQLQKKTDINRSFLYVLLACSAMCAGVLLWHGQMVFIAMYILYSSVNVIRLPLLQSMIANRSTPESRNSLMGFYQSMNSLGGIFGALFAGLIYSHGKLLPFALALCAYLAATAIGIGYTRKYQKEIT